MFNDTSFNLDSLKGMNKYISIHGITPLKTLGRKDKTGFYGIGNVQKNFLVADYLLYPNEYMMKHMLEDYMISNIGTGKVVLNGYPRNTIFLNKDRRNELRAKLKIKDKQIIAYMPTWRGKLGDLDEDPSIKEIVSILKELDKKYQKIKYFM